MTSIQWKEARFNDLSLSELYELLRLRSQVFVVEQDCVYQDLDGLDQESWHLLGFLDGTLVAYARLLPPGLAYPTPAIGRIVVPFDQRKMHYGQAVVQRSIKFLQYHFKGQDIAIMAQLYLEGWYEQFGFKRVSDVFLEDGIPHIKMVLPTL